MHHQSFRIRESSVEKESRSPSPQKKLEKIIEAEKAETGRVRGFVGFLVLYEFLISCLEWPLLISCPNEII